MLQKWRIGGVLSDTYQKWTARFGAATAVLGLLGLSGWVLGMPLLASIRASYIPMAPVTSIALMCLGGIVLFYGIMPQEGGSGKFATVLSALISAYGLVELVEYVGIPLLSLEERLFPNPSMIGAIPTERMSPTTAAILLLSGAVVPILVLRARAGKRKDLLGNLAGCLAIIVAMSGIVFVLGYLHGAPLLYGSMTIPMAATTAIGVLLLGIGQIFATGPGSFPLRSIRGSSARARLLRVFVSTTVGVVLGIDLLHIYAPLVFLEHNAFLSGISTAAIAVVTGALIARVALKVGNEMDRSEEVRKQAEERLRETTRRLELATSSGGIGVWDWDISSNSVVWDDRMFELYGIRKDAFSNGVEAWEKSLHREDYAAVIECLQAAIRGEKEFDTEFRVMHPDGTIRYLQANAVIIRNAEGKALRMIGMNRDMTDQRKLEDRLRQSQKIEAVGRLAGGVAHDFNNLLTVIIGYSEVLLSQLDKQTAQHKEVEEIKRAGERAAALTGQLLAFSRRQVLQPKVLDLNELVSGMGKMLRRLINENVEFRTDFGTGLWKVKADPGQIEQVAMNLVVNARDAMPQGGKLTIETSNIVLSEEYSHSHVPVSPGEYVMLAISDTGVGMDEKTASQVFEPFFTTKEMGKGTGLGLATVYGIVKQSGGFIWVYSEPGKGSTFKVYLPRTWDREETSHEVGSLVEDLRGNRTILLAEDDESLRKMAAGILRQYGYTVLPAGNGEEALRVAEAHDGRIGLLLTDVVMPGMGGPELYNQLRQLRRGIKVLYMSGYTDNAIVNQGVLEPGIAFLQKPYSPISLARKVKEVLELLSG